MATEAPTEAERKAEQFHTTLKEEGVSIPTTSGMARMLQRIINTFRPRTDYSKDWVDQQGEDERIDTAINKFANTRVSRPGPRTAGGRKITTGSSRGNGCSCRDSSTSPSSGTMR